MDSGDQNTARDKKGGFWDTLLYIYVIFNDKNIKKNFFSSFGSSKRRYKSVLVIFFMYEKALC